MNFSDLDLLSLVSSEFVVASRECKEEFLYKYYSFPSAEIFAKFLRRPTVKFTHVLDPTLNDPFEMTRRWESFGSEVSAQIIRKILTRNIEDSLNDKNFLASRIIEHPRFSGTGKKPSDIYALIDGPMGAFIRAEFKKSVLENIPMLLDAFFSQSNNSVDNLIEALTSKIGIFSLTSNPLNRVMWGLYAAAGSGFALQFDAQSIFFKAKQNDGSLRNRLHRVVYTDERSSDFWSNPNYLFAAKNLEFQFEQEWRMMVDVGICDRLEIGGGNVIYTLPVPQGMIKRIIFGHRYDRDEAARVFDKLRSFDSDITSAFVRADRSSGEYCFDYEVLNKS